MKSLISALIVLVALSAFGQSGPTMRTTSDVLDNVRGSIVGTVTSVMETRNQFIVALDGDRYGTVTIQGDSLSTTFRGFGGSINGAPEVFQGSTGMANLREGDHVEVRGVGAGNTTINAEQVILLGRSEPADQVGVGQTRTPSSPATPTAGYTGRSDSTTARVGNVEGIVREINAGDNRIVILTDRREMIGVRGTGTTPVYYRENVYHIANLEVGDRVRISPESASSTGEIRARSIDVVQNVQDPQASTQMPARGVGSLSGRVSALERHSNFIRIQPDTGRGPEVRVDLSNTVDENNHPVRPYDIQVGDRVTLSGSYNGSNVFVASNATFEAATDVDVPPAPAPKPEPAARIGVVNIYGTVTQPLSAGSPLVIHETTSNRTVSVYVTDDLVVRGKSAGYTTADRLKPGDGVAVKAFRDGEGNLIAQTIRLR
jgi:Domain of unknown function (DUF5666)